MKTPVEIAIELVGSHKCKDESCSLVARVADGISEERLHQAKLEAELSDLRSLDRHKDKDWSKWYGLYNQKCERVVELEQQLAQLQQEKETLLKSMGVWELMEQKKKDIAQLQEDAKRNESLVQQLQELDKDWHELRDERDKLQEENTRLKNLMGRTS